MNKKPTLKYFFLSLLLTKICSGTVLNVPANYSTIQAAINASVNGDTVLVAPGTYFENINLRGKNIMLTSLFPLTGDTSYVYSTIINGSQPANPDTASCIIINSGEDSTAFVEGFTITGGMGTKWTDEHGAGVYREGGGIIIQYSSPVIQHNLIVNNEAINASGVSGCGGGGIRIGDGNPVIRNNTIAHNLGRYGSAIVLNYTGAVVKKNLICYNSGANAYGGATVWSNGSSTVDRIIENNTISHNSSLAGTAGFYASFTTGYQLLINNIIYDNASGTSTPEIAKGGTSPLTVTYCDVENGYSGAGNINVPPMFSDTDYFYLDSLSGCIDAGDSSTVYNDFSTNGVNALFPSMGGLRNDMGAYGGLGAGWLPSANPVILAIRNIEPDIEFSITPNPAASEFTISINLQHNIDLKISITDITGKKILKIAQSTLNAGSHSYHIGNTGLKPGIYFCVLKSEEILLTKKLMVM